MTPTGIAGVTEPFPDETLAELPKMLADLRGKLPDGPFFWITNGLLATIAARDAALSRRDAEIERLAQIAHAEREAAAFVAKRHDEEIKRVRGMGAESTAILAKAGIAANEEIARLREQVKDIAANYIVCKEAARDLHRALDCHDCGNEESEAVVQSVLVANRWVLGDTPPETESDLYRACPGRGRCHGSMKWCGACGNVAATCDAGTCDVHRMVMP